MSSIDQYKHKLLGFINCPSSFDIVYENPTRDVAIYLLLEDIPLDEEKFDGKTGDILLGGGSGEAAAFRISMPKAMLFFFQHDWCDFESRDEIFKAFWSPTASYQFCEGYSKLGWDPNSAIEFWMAENLCNILVERFDQFKIYRSANGPLKSALTFIEG
jgi:hypothetical protein